jgi:hypothetical protein
VRDLGERIEEPIWVEPFPDPPAADDVNPESRYERRETIELGFVSAM